MTIEWLRDLVIVIFGIAATILAIVLTVVALKLYSKVKPILESARDAAKTASDISNTIKEVVAPPLSYIAAIIQGISQACKICGRFIGKKEGK